MAEMADFDEHHKVQVYATKEGTMARLVGRLAAPSDTGWSQVHLLLQPSHDYYKVASCYIPIKDMGICVPICISIQDSSGTGRG